VVYRRAAQARALDRGLRRAHHELLQAPGGPGYEAPVNLAYSRRNRSAAVRIPMYSASPKAKRLEFRPPTHPATRISRLP